MISISNKKLSSVSRAHFQTPRLLSSGVPGGHRFPVCQEVQSPTIFLFDFKLVILPILQKHISASRTGKIMQVIAFIKTGTPSIFKGFRKRVDLAAAD